jgi:hypothetical protein
MSDTKHILVLANSERVGGRCVAGKIATPLDGGNFDIGQQWVRLNNPTTKEGAVPYMDTVCRPNHTAVRPLDLIQVPLLDPCNNPDHPEDWNYDTTQKWKWIASAKPQDLAAIVDTPASLWNAESDAVPAGYIRRMAPPPASLYLIKAPRGWTFKYFKEWNQYKGYDKKRRRLQFSFAGSHHDMSVTDSEFDHRFKLPGAVSQWPSMPETLPVPNPDAWYFCLSLTPELNGKQYKICATFFET